MLVSPDLVHAWTCSMSRTLDALSDDVPHGTVEGYRQGCRTSHCPAGQEHGLSCALANTYAAGNWQYMKAIQRGLTPAEIAAFLDLHPAGEKPAPKKKQTVKHTDVPAPTTPPKEKTVTEQPKTNQAEVRAWARETGIDVPTRGTLPRAIVDAFNARGKGIQASDVKPEPAPPIVSETAPEPETPPPATQVYASAPKTDWSLPLTPHDLRRVADALEAFESVPADIIRFDAVPVYRPDGDDVIGDFVAAPGFDGDDGWFGFVPRDAA